MDFDPISRYHGLDEFYQADPRRECGTTDFGVLWRDGVCSSGNWRISWIEPTGEVYAYELRPGGTIVVLAERLRLPAVELALSGWQTEHALPWVWKALAIPRVPAEFAGYVGETRRRIVWVVRDGWVERALEPTGAARRASPSGFSWGYAGGGPYATADSILADHLGHPVARDLADRFKSDVVAGWNRLRQFVISSETIADWLAAAGVGGSESEASLERV